jgi:hypothetical protein
MCGELAVSRIALLVDGDAIFGMTVWRWASRAWMCCRGIKNDNGPGYIDV